MKVKYEKPTIKKVKLVPSEAVLQSCKTEVMIGPMFTGCTAMNAAYCVTPGS